MEFCVLKQICDEWRELGLLTETRRSKIEVWKTVFNLVACIHQLSVLVHVLSNAFLYFQAREAILQKLDYLLLEFAKRAAVCCCLQSCIFFK